MLYDMKLFLCSVFYLKLESSQLVDSTLVIPVQGRLRQCCVLEVSQGHITSFHFQEKAVRPGVVVHTWDT